MSIQSNGNGGHRYAPGPLEGVIFDLDGLLVDSEPLQFRAYQRAFADHGLQFQEPDWAHWHRIGSSAAAWIAHIGSRVDPEKVRESKRTYYEQLIASELTLKPGVQALLEDLAVNHVRLCIASGSRLDSIVACLRRLRLAHYFERLFSATIVPNKKPHPDVFNLAMGEMGLSCRRTIAIEDSHSGLQAARAAGLSCVVCPDEFVARGQGEYEGAALRVSSLSELSTEVLEQVCLPHEGTPDA